MAGSAFGKLFRVTTWGESHGRAIGAVIDGCPAGLSLREEDLQPYLDRRRPGNNPSSSSRIEPDRVLIMSGTFEGKTTGTPICLMVMNKDADPDAYTDLKDVYRPGHADFTYERKYGFRDYRGGGRSSGRETVGRVAAGAVAILLLREFGITVTAYTESIGPVRIGNSISIEERDHNAYAMPDPAAAAEAEKYIRACMDEGNSCGGIIACVANGVPAGLGEPVFDKLDAELSKAVMSIGAVKGVEIGSGFSAATMRGDEQNDAFLPAKESSGDQTHSVRKQSNHAGGILGGISDGSPILLRAAVKPTPSIRKEQQTVNNACEPVSLSISGRHDATIVPRAVVIVESMVALTLADALLVAGSGRLDFLKTIWKPS